MATQPRQKGALVNTDPSRENLLALWNRIRELGVDLAAAQATITSQQTVITTLQSQQTTTEQQTQQALILAGKAASQSATGVPPAPGGGGGDGGGGGSGDSHPNHYDLVVEAKADLITEGESLVGDCGAFKITRRAAQYIAPSDPAVGLLDKPPPGTNCTNYSIDNLCYNDGVLYDILQDAGGANTPQWNFNGTVDPSRYRPPF